jgi:pilus assembly protein CpaD
MKPARIIVLLIAIATGGFAASLAGRCYGCASQRNLAAMVDDPADLVQPRAETPIYGGRRSTVLDKFRRGEVSGTAAQNAEKGKISDVGK